MSRLVKLVAEAQQHLEPGEQILVAIQGSYETKRMGKDSVRSGIFAATDRRLIFYAKRLTGYDVEVFPYENISSIEMGKSMMGYHIEFFASGNEVKMKWINSDRVGEFIQAVNARMKGGTAGDAAHNVQAATDIADQIRKLAELRDEGILSDDEFEAHKLKLLSV